MMALVSMAVEAALRGETAWMKQAALATLQGFSFADANLEPLYKMEGVFTCGQGSDDEWRVVGHQVCGIGPLMNLAKAEVKREPMGKTEGLVAAATQAACAAKRLTSSSMVLPLCITSPSPLPTRDHASDLRRGGCRRGGRIAWRHSFVEARWG